MPARRDFPPGCTGNHYSRGPLVSCFHGRSRSLKYGKQAQRPFSHCSDHSCHQLRSVRRDTEPKILQTLLGVRMSWSPVASLVVLLVVVAAGVAAKLAAQRLLRLLRLLVIRLVRLLTTTHANSRPRSSSWQVCTQSPPASKCGSPRVSTISALFTKTESASECPNSLIGPIDRLPDFSLAQRSRVL